MSDAPKPDAIVREPEARASVDELTKGLAEDARHNGLIPPMAEIEAFAKEVTREQIARHEERFRQGVPDAKNVERGRSSGTATLDRGTFEDDFGTVEKIARPFDPQRHAAKTKGLTLGEALEQRLVEMRLAMLLGYRNAQGRIVTRPENPGDAEAFPEWAARIRKTWQETLVLSRNLQLTAAQARSNAADAVLRILDESSTLFGDWRHPRGPDGKPIHFVAVIDERTD